MAESTTVVPANERVTTVDELCSVIADLNQRLLSDRKPGINIKKVLNFTTGTVNSDGDYRQYRMNLFAHLPSLDHNMLAHIQGNMVSSAEFRNANRRLLVLLEEVLGDKDEETLAPHHRLSMRDNGIYLLWLLYTKCTYGPTSPFAFVKTAADRVVFAHIASFENQEAYQIHQRLFLSICEQKAHDDDDHDDSSTAREPPPKRHRGTSVTRFIVPIFEQLLLVDDEAFCSCLTQLYHAFRCGAAVALGVKEIKTPLDLLDTTRRWTIRKDGWPTPTTAVATSHRFLSNA